MMSQLKKWSIGDKPSVAESAHRAALKLPLTGTPVPVDIPKFMGKWFVMANIPLYLEIGASNCVENYMWNAETKSIEVLFEYVAKGGSPAAPKSISEMHAKIVNNPVNSFWTLNPKILGIYLPLGLSYLVLDVAEDGSYALVGVPDRQNLWILTRLKPTKKAGGPYLETKNAAFGSLEINPTTPATDTTLPCVSAAREIFELDANMEGVIMQRALAKAAELGYDVKKVLSIEWTE